MKFFTPELYQEYQDISIDMEDKWDQACLDYEDYLKSVELPESVNNYLKKVNLHDAEVVGKDKKNDSIILIVHQENWGADKFICLLEYKNVVVTEEKWGFIKNPKHPYDSIPGELLTDKSYWMYDEFLVEGEYFIHNIMLSDGVVLKIKFKTFEFVKSKIEN